MLQKIAKLLQAYLVIKLASGETGIALAHATLRDECAFDRVNHTAELGERGRRRSV